MRSNTPAATDTLETFIAAHAVGLASAELRRKGKVVKSWTFEGADGEAVKADERPADVDKLADEIHDAAEVPGKYRVALQRARGARGPAPAPVVFSHVVVDDDDDDALDRSHKRTEKEVSIKLFEGVSAVNIKLIDRMSDLVDKVGAAMGSIVAANAQVLEQQRTVAAQDTTAAEIKFLSERDARRERFAAQVLGPFLAAARDAMGIKARATQGKPAALPEAEPLAVRTRSLIAGVTAAQRERISPALLTLLDVAGAVSTDAAAVAAVADILAHDESDLLAALDVLTESQALALTELSEAVQDFKARQAAAVEAAGSVT